MTAARANILIVDDESTIRQALRTLLGSFGLDVAEAATGEQALELLGKASFDAVLLDMNMPGMGGTMTCREIRRRVPSLPILMLTVRDGQEEKVEAFDAGADDYVTKPFHIRELTARVRAALRRSQTLHAVPDQSIRIGEITLNPSLRTVEKKGQLIRLTPKEFELLQYLMTHAGTPLAHGRLLTAVWGADYGGELEYLRTFIHQLRRKLEDNPTRPSYLVTEAWFGYRFRAHE